MNSDKLSHFLLEMQEGDELYISPELYANKLALEEQRLAELAHVHRNTVRRMPKSPQLQKCLRESIRALGAATDLVGSASKASILVPKSTNLGLQLQDRRGSRLGRSC